MVRLDTPKERRCGLIGRNIPMWCMWHWRDSNLQVSGVRMWLGERWRWRMRSRECIPNRCCLCMQNPLHTRSCCRSMMECRYMRRHARLGSLWFCMAVPGMLGSRTGSSPVCNTPHPNNRCHTHNTQAPSRGCMRLAARLRCRICRVDSIRCIWHRCIHTT
jgi:hypothetical protein